MLTRRQIAKIEKSLANRTGSDIKISRTQIRKSVKYGTIHITLHPFTEVGKTQLVRGLKKKSHLPQAKQGKGLLLGKKSPFNSIPIIGQIL